MWKDALGRTPRKLRQFKLVRPRLTVDMNDLTTLQTEGRNHEATGTLVEAHGNIMEELMVTPGTPNRKSHPQTQIIHADTPPEHIAAPPHAALGSNPERPKQGTAGRQPRQPTAPALSNAPWRQEVSDRESPNVSRKCGISGPEMISSIEPAVR